MNKLKVCFIGLGSIAKRHIMNLHAVCKSRNIDLIVDAYRRESIMSEGVNTVYTDYSSVPTDYDVIFITNPTAYHLDTLIQFHNNGKHFFIEKPVVSLDKISEAKNLILRQESIYYVASPLRYNAVIQYLKKKIVTDEVISVRAISSSYLPDWRPNQDYRDTYSAHKDLGGGVDVDLIHEWDYLSYIFGAPISIHSFKGKGSSLDIDSNDFAIYIAKFPKQIVELHLDYFGRKTIREIQLFTESDTIVGNLVENKINFLVSGNEIVFYEERDDYQRREINYFLDMMYGIEQVEDGFHHGLQVLDYTQG